MKSAKLMTHLLRGCHRKMPLTELLEDEDAALLRVHLLDVVEPDKGLERERMHFSFNLKCKEEGSGTFWIINSIDFERGSVKLGCTEVQERYVKPTN